MMNTQTGLPLRRRDVCNLRPLARCGSPLRPVPKIQRALGRDVRADLDRFRVTSAATLAWYDSSPCRAAADLLRPPRGKPVLEKPAGEDRMAIAAGALDGATGLRLTRHIFTEDAGDYYRPEGPPPDAPAAPADRLDACLCGDVAFSLPGPAGRITARHCTQCRKLSGHYSASFDADESTITWHSRQTLGEYETPAKGRRGSCTRCGSSLWFRSAAGEFSVEAGAVTGQTGGRLAEHIFAGSKGDYYDIDDGLPCATRW